MPNNPPAPTAATVTLRTLDLPLPGNRLLRLALTHDANGRAQELVIGAAFEGRPLLDTLSEGLNVPASALPALRDALAELAP